MALAHQLRGPALGFDRFFNRQRIIGAVGINLARLVGDNRRGDRDIGLVGRSGLDVADEPVSLSAAICAL
jgi:hypothetical protein